MTLNDTLADRRPPAGTPGWLLAAAALETVTLAVLILNRTTVDVRWLAAGIGPVHGGLYLTVIIATIVLKLGRRPTLLALIPAVGGLLALRAAHRAHRPAATDTGTR